MSDVPPLEAQEELQAWVRQALESAIQELMDKNVVDTLLIEAKPAWVFPFQILIGKFRERGQRVGHTWFICGDGIPTDHTKSFKATSPRDAARHFALKWQLDAAKAQKEWEEAGGKWMPGARQAHGQEELIKQAEALYELTTVDQIWEQ
jgi:hypothetical protein